MRSRGPGPLPASDGSGVCRGRLSHGAAGRGRWARLSWSLGPSLMAEDLSAIFKLKINSFCSIKRTTDPGTRCPGFFSFRPCVDCPCPAVLFAVPQLCASEEPAVSLRCCLLTHCPALGGCCSPPGAEGTCWGSCGVGGSHLASNLQLFLPLCLLQFLSSVVAAPVSSDYLQVPKTEKWLLQYNFSVFCPSLRSVASLFSDFIYTW